ncbi:MAG: NAD(P)H:quinone oxidoreductase type IV [Salibaculum sp.]|jgi:NAD(P)H dehydrogenase (quinone)|uniref:NAD(P)H:quinone oxidoreductase type IV n=1 Tax=Salibaculum sp. TaxID=2855480 RepID=UPI0028707A3E|nr:NAD(P)H:quinone oxidoreductase type IV [Salibaculum sp.]MDR9428868.1 NAD(P)H:quinone oxidoreductase type IV [Salibaculum sp.]MDR9483301.1 NAD(P)H:quinone oxidoreductase type IV [Salibaculum sp.]
MTTPKITIIYYSTYGTNYGVAQTAAKAAQEAGAEVRLRRVRETAPAEVVAGQDAWQAAAEAQSDVPEASLDDVDWADGLFFSSPTRFGTVTSQMRAFIDTLGPLWMEGKLVDKAVTATTSSQNPNGGAESTLLGFYTTFMHWGAILVVPGYTDGVKFEDGGNPYGFSTTPGELGDIGQRSVAHQAKRLVQISAKLAG